MAARGPNSDIEYNSYSIALVAVLNRRASCSLARIRGMGRYTFPAFTTATTPRYVVLWDLHWHVLDCQRLEPAADLSGAMAETIDRLAGEGWEAEATPEYGFVFVRREAERRLLMLTPRDPYNTEQQSFSPFASAGKEPQG